MAAWHFKIRKIIAQKETGRRISQLAGASKIKKNGKNALTQEEAKRRGFAPYKDPFRITPHYRETINFLAQKIRDRKPVSESQTQTRVLFVCPEGLAFSVITKNNFNDLVKNLGLSDIVYSHSSNARLEGISRDTLEKIRYIVPRYNDLDSAIKVNLYKAGDNPPEILPMDVLSMTALNDPAPYRAFLINILNRIKRAHARHPSQSKLHAAEERKRKWDDMPWGKP